MSHFYIATHDWCYRASGNDKPGLHVVAGPFDSKAAAEEIAFMRTSSNKTKHLVLELVSGYELAPEKIITIPT